MPFIYLVVGHVRQMLFVVRAVCVHCVCVYIDLAWFSAIYVITGNIWHSTTICFVSFVFIYLLLYGAASIPLPLVSSLLMECVYYAAMALVVA